MSLQMEFAMSLVVSLNRPGSTSSSHTVLILEDAENEMLIILGRVGLHEKSQRTKLVADGAQVLRFLRAGGEEDPWENYLSEKTDAGWTVIEQESATATLKKAFQGLSAA
jgi:hypothetical protein